MITLEAECVSRFLSAQRITKVDCTFACCAETVCATVTAVKKGANLHSTSRKKWAFGAKRAVSERGQGRRRYNTLPQRVAN